MKTLIELFDECQIENIMAALLLKPERIVFVGFKETMTTKRISAIENFFKSRGIKALLLFEIVGRFDFDAVKERIAEITEKYPDSVFDITGGKELVIAAMGEAISDKNIPVVQFDVKKGKVVMCKGCDGIIPENGEEGLEIAEIIALNGGSVIAEANKWTFDADFIKDIKRAWSIAKESCGSWNRQTTAFGNFEKYGKINGNLLVKADFHKLKNAKKEFYLNERIINLLINEGLIYGYEEKGGNVSFCYKNENVRRLITKAGNVLELYAYIMINEIKGRVTDSKVGVIIDWDGVDLPGAETRNEIDIMLIKGLTLVFISCKNGEVYKEALYELDALARNFGGEYSEKVMFATYLSEDKDKKEYLKIRAKDMGIRLISGIEEMTEEEFKGELESVVK